MSSRYETSCRCGAVKIRISGQPLAQVYCHCDDCQTAHGAAYVRTAAYPAAAIEVLTGQPSAVIVKTASRMRCAACGTFLFTEVDSAALRSVNAYLLPKEQFKPQFHVHCQHAVLPVIDGLPHYKALPAVFGGTDELVDW